MADAENLHVNSVVNALDRLDIMKTGGGDKEEKNQTGEIDGDSLCFGKPGSQIDYKVVFKNKFGESVSAIPVIVDFNRLLQLKQTGESEGVISGVSNRDLLHAVVGLYDISLPDMETETIYATVCARWSRTIVLVQDVKDAADDMTERNIKRRRKKEKKMDKNLNKGVENKTVDKNWRRKIDESNDIYKEVEASESFSAFVDIFSDTDEDSDEEEEAEEEASEDENFSKGVFTFLSAATKRQKKRESCDAIISGSMIGIENRLLACITFEKKYIEHKDRVIHLTLISVRPRFRLFRIGRYLLSKIVTPTVVGLHEAIVVHADNSAVEFFRKFGFSDDIILNSRWSQLAEAFTNCTLMSYLPAFASHNLLQMEITKDDDLVLYELDQEMKAWQKKSREAYLGQLCCMMRYRNEILQLKHLVKAKNEVLKKDNVNKNAFKLEAEEFDEINTDQLLADLEKEVATLSAVRHSSTSEAALPSPPPPVRSDISLPSAPFKVDTKAEIITRFVKGMEMDVSLNIQYMVSSIVKAPDNPTMCSRFETALINMAEPTMVTELYFCGSLEKPKRLVQILSDGFAEEDFIHGEYGKGLYFSKYPSKAAQFSRLGKLLEVKVGLGRVETVLRYDKTRKAPSATNDSIIVPGRLFRAGECGESAMLCQEYVVFNVNQVMPICLLSYTYLAS